MRFIFRATFCFLLGLIGTSANTHAADTAAVSKLLDKYESRGLPRFRIPELYGEISERLENQGGLTAILAGRYLAYQEQIETERRNHQLPWFVGFLPAANTGFEPRFRNESGYAGLWPLPYLMGKKYGLTQTALFDERHDAKKSTEAACLYLSDLQIIYRDWLMSITAFSIGPARLNQVIHATKTLNFDSVYNALEPEERVPVIQWLATAVVVSEWLDLEKPVVPLNRAALKTVLGIEKAIPFALFYDKFGLGIAQMRDYNPGLRTDLIPYMGKLFSFNLPVELAGRYEKARDSIPLWLNGVPRMEITYDTITQVFDGDSVELVEPVQAVVTPTPLASREDKVWVYYKVKRGDAVYTITDVFDCNIADMRRWNNLNSRMVLIVGKRLKFYVPAQKKKYYQQIDRMTMAQKRERAKSNN